MILMMQNVALEGWEKIEWTALPYTMLAWFGIFFLSFGTNLWRLQPYQVIIFFSIFSLLNNFLEIFVSHKVFGLYGSPIPYL